MRRIVLEDPFARSAIWSRNLAIFALIVAAIGVGLSRKGLDPQAALSIIGAALGVAVFAILFAFVAMAVIWRTGFRGIGLALLGIVLSGLLFAYPLYIAVQAHTAPPATDISTDLDDPPHFLETPTALAVRHGHRTPRQSQAAKDLQLRLYPDLQTLSLDADVDDVTHAIHKLIKRRHWTIVDEVAAKNFATGHIDVLAKSTVMGFPIDITFRIRELGNKTNVDVRSVSRAGWQELPGSNAARVEDIVSQIEDAVGDS